MAASTLLHPAEKNSTNLLSQSILFTQLQNTPGEFLKIHYLSTALSINDNGLSTSVHYKPTDSHNYLLHWSSHPQHVRNAIPFSPFLRLRHRFSKRRLPWLRCNHRQTSRPRNRPRHRTTNVTERRNQPNSTHPHLPSTKPCSQKCNPQKLQNSPQWFRD